MISLDEALELLLGGVDPLGSETVPLAALHRRILAQPVIATHDQPAEPRSVMDGIAVCRIDALDYHLVGESRAGAPFAGRLGSGEAVAISTGAVVPEGANQVVPKEMVTREGDVATLDNWPSSSFIRPYGSDFREGENLLEKGRVLDPAAIALVAAANRADAIVAKRPRVAILATGDELVQPGSPLETGASIDSASHGLAALVEEWGGIASRVRIVADDIDDTVTALDAALTDVDLVVTVGGASVGAHDHIRPAAQRLGADILFDRIAVQPGKPSWHARMPGHGMILGLPGNPTSAFVCAHLLLRPLLDRMSGGDAGLVFVTAALDAPLPRNGAREQFVRAVRASAPGEALRLRPLANQDSGLQAALARATHLVRRKAGAPDVDSGDQVAALELRQ